MADNHPAIQLLLKRMESHPHEFSPTGKWRQIVQEILQWGDKEERAKVRNALRTLHLDRVHRQMMKELLDG